MSFAVALESEIVRLARKELRREAEALKRVASRHRAEIAALKRRVKEPELEVRRQARVSNAPSRRGETEAAEKATLRFSAKGLAAQRKQLGLSANDLGLLVGVPGQSIYNWESGQTRPREGQLRIFSNIGWSGVAAHAIQLAAAVRAGLQV